MIFTKRFLFDPSRRRMSVRNYAHDCIYENTALSKVEGGREMLNNLKALFQPSQRDIFNRISGHNDVKWLLTKALRADKPVHVLLQGEPGLGKTAFLKCIEREYPNKALFVSANGALTSGAGLTDELFRKQPKFLLLDELEYFKKSDQAMLFELMQSGRLIETKVKTGGRREIQLNCVVFATCNDTKKLQAPLMSRFIVKKIEPYSESEFVTIAIDKLPCEPLFARFIAVQVWVHMENPNIRECERIESMCHTEAEVLEYLKVIED
jgi:hypothetical protein